MRRNALALKSTRDIYHPLPNVLLNARESQRCLYLGRRTMANTTRAIGHMDGTGVNAIARQVLMAKGHVNNQTTMDIACINIQPRVS